MQPDTEQSLGTTPATPPRNTRRAVALLLHAAAPERRHVVLGTVWLVAAGATVTGSRSEVNELR